MEAKFPITTHLRMYSQKITDSLNEEKSRQELVLQPDPECHFEDVHFVDGEEADEQVNSDSAATRIQHHLCLTRIHGCDASTTLLRIEESDEMMVLKSESIMPCFLAKDSPHACWLSPRDETAEPLVYLSESRTRLPWLQVGSAEVQLSHREILTSLATVTTITLPERNGHSLQALLCEPHPPTPSATASNSPFRKGKQPESDWERKGHRDGSEAGEGSAAGKDLSELPLLVHIHGGPAGAFRSILRIAAAHTDHPYRVLLAAGCKVVMPLYSGTLGYGDEFSRSNIHKQGQVDVQDVMRVVHYLREKGVARGPTGVFGGSYGGFLACKLMATLPDVFSVGVCEYGFVQVRQMSLEGGDYTWESEYCGSVEEWPPPHSYHSHECVHQMNLVSSPLLFTHGEEDDICPVSQSKVCEMTSGYHDSAIMSHPLYPTHCD